MKANSKMEKEMVLERIFGNLDKYMKVNGKTIREMALDKISIRMEKFMREKAFLQTTT